MMTRKSRTAVLLMLAAFIVPGGAWAQQSALSNEMGRPFWVGIGLGGGSINSLAPAPAADRGAVSASIEVGYRLHPRWAAGLELAALVPVSGCARLDCVDPARFAPTFSRLFAFSEYRPANSGWRLRAAAGVSRFCYQSHWSSNAWSWLDTLNLVLFDELYEDVTGTGGWRCDARRHALGGSLSVGYDWVRNQRGSMGVRLSAEAASFDHTPAAALPAFGHRAVVLSMHLDLR